MIKTLLEKSSLAAVFLMYRKEFRRIGLLGKKTEFPSLFGMSWNMVYSIFFIKLIQEFLENQTNCGQILASFQFLEGPPKANLLKTVDIRPKTEKYQVVIKILGLRGLKSLGLFPVSRPFIKFDINGMKTNERKESLYEKKSLKTQPSEVGSNPNICTILTFEVELPIDTTYCPSLNVYLIPFKL